MDKLQSMAVLVRVAERGSFAAAAEEFRISGTMVGHHVRALEDWLGGKLLNRTTRRQSLTELGKTAYDRFKEILREVSDVEALGASASHEVSGQLRVMAPVSFGSHALAPVLHRYIERYPNVTLDLVLSDKRLDITEEGFDVVIRVGPLDDSTMKARPLAPYRSILCASPAYLARHGNPANPDQLQKHRCLGFANPVASRRWRLTGSAGECLVPVNLVLAVNNGEALRLAALSGLGIVMQPEVLLNEDLRTGRLKPLLKGFVADVRPTHVLLHPDRRPTPKVRTFVDFLVAMFGVTLCPELKRKSDRR